MQAVLDRQHRPIDRTRLQALENLRRRGAGGNLQSPGFDPRSVPQHRKRRHVAVRTQFALDCHLHRQPPSASLIEISFPPRNWQPHSDPTQLTTRMAPQLVFDRPMAERIAGQVQEKRMLWTITIVLFILWLLGMVSSYTLGGWIHILLVLAVIVLIFNLLSGRRAV